jgi:hypothetical protein
MDQRDLPVGDDEPNSRPRRRRFVPLVWIASGAAVVLLATGVGGTLSGFTASINNTTNTAGSGTLLMEEDQATTTCFSTGSSANPSSVDATNAGTCATINKLGGNLNMVPGQTVTAGTVTIKNNGSSAAKSFTLKGTGCTQSNQSVAGSAGDFCSKLNLTITGNNGGQGNIYSGTLASLGSNPIDVLSKLGQSGAGLAAGASDTFVFAVTLDPSANNSYQGLAASNPLTWSFAS